MTRTPRIPSRMAIHHASLVIRSKPSNTVNASHMNHPQLSQDRSQNKKIESKQPNFAELTELARNQFKNKSSTAIDNTWTILKWSPDNFRYVPQNEIHTQLKTSNSKRLPRVDSIIQKLKATDDTAHEFYNLLEERPLEAEIYVSQLPKTRIDVIEDYTVALAAKLGRVPLLHPLIQDRHDQIKLAICQDRFLSSESNSQDPLALLSEPMPEYKLTGDYTQLYDSLSPEEKKRFDLRYSQHSLSKQLRIDSSFCLSPQVRDLRDKWQASIQFRSVPGFKCLRTVQDDIALVVATELARVISSMAAVTFPKPLTSLCKRIGAVLEDLVLSKKAQELNMPYWSKSSPFLWALIGGSPWSTKEKLIVGSVYIEQALRKCKFLQPHPNTGELVQRPAFWKTFYMKEASRRGVVLINPALLRSLKQGGSSFSQSIAGLSIPPPGPQQLPLLIPPRKWTSTNDGGSSLSNTARNINLLASGQQSHEQMAMINHGISANKMDTCLKGVDKLANCAWSVNKVVLKAIETLLADRTSISDMPALSDNSDISGTRHQASSSNYTRGYEDSMISMRTKDGEGAKSGEKSKSESDKEVVQFVQAISIAQSLAKHGERFYSPVYMDFRGRCYSASGSKLNHMGSDSMRALHNFWYGRKLGAHGLRALELHLANVYGAAQGQSIEDRLTWAKSHRHDIVKTATDPFGSGKWWMEGQKPFQVLAAATEIGNALASGDHYNYISRLPVATDGSCNGLQHLAALGRDQSAASFVNLLPSMDRDKPGDLYEHIARLVEDRVELKNITRQTVKGPVMTLFYGATTHALIQSLLSQFKMDDAVIVANAIKETVKELCQPEFAIKDWITESATRILKSTAVSTFSEGESTPQVCSIAWTQPTGGLPVVQPYVESKLIAVRTPLQSFFIASPLHEAKADMLKQQQSVAPNYIHSLDAAHMLLTAQKFSGHFAAVHDSFWTHAADMDELNRTLRETFLSVHHRDLLVDLRNEWQVRYAGRYHLCEVRSSSKLYEKIKWLRSGKRCNASILREEFEQEVLNQRSQQSDVDVSKPITTPWSLFTAQDIASIQYKNGEPFIGATGYCTKIWIPLMIADPPQRGTLDMKEVVRSSYFFN